MMKKNIYLIEHVEYIKGRGVERFNNEFTNMFGGVNRIIVGCSSDKCEIDENGLSVFRLAGHDGHYPTDSGWLFLSKNIEDSPDTWFVFNIGCCAKHILRMKSVFQMAKAMRIVHGTDWQYKLMGDEKTAERLAKGGNIHTAKEMEAFLAIKMEQEDIRHSDAYVVLADSVGKVAKCVMPNATNITVIPNPVSLPVFKKRNIKELLGVRKSDTIFLFIGANSKEKAMSECIKAFNDADMNDAVLIVAGNEKDVPHWENNVLRLGRIDEEMVCSLAYNADYCIIPSYFENCTYVGITYKMLGKKIIASDSIGLRDMFGGQHHNVLLFYRSLIENGNFSSVLLEARNRLVEETMPDCDIYRPELAAWKYEQVFNRPRVSVFMFITNGDKYNTGAIESILEQDYSDFELVIINNGNKDAKEIKTKYKDRRIVYIDKPELEGQIIPELLNFGIAKCRGKYIAITDMETISMQGRLSEQVRLMEEHGYDICFSPVLQKNELFSRVHHTFTCNVVNPLEKLAVNNFFHHSTAMFRTDAFCGFPIYKQAEYYAAWVEMAASGARFYGFRKPLVECRKIRSISSLAHQRAMENVKALARDKIKGMRT